MENRQLITLGARNKSISKLKANIHLENQQTEPCYTSGIPTEPHPVSQPFKLIQTQILPSKENLSSSNHPVVPNVPNVPFHHVTILRENHALSHPNFYIPTLQSRIVESKEKVRTNIMTETMYVKSRQGSPVNQSNSRSKFVQNQSNKNLLSLTLNQSANQVQLLSKIKTLEQIISQKQAENHHLQSIILHERKQNQNILMRAHGLANENEGHKARIQQLEEMLEREISKSLELMDNGDTFSKEIEDIRAEILVKDTLVKTLQQELKISHERMTKMSSDVDSIRKDCESKIEKATNQMELAKQDNDSRVKELQTKLSSIECELLRVSQLSVEKDGLISRLESQHQNQIQKIVMQKQSRVNELSIKINTQATQITSLQSQIQSLSKSQSRFFSTQQRPQPQSDKAECKKCKELLQTVFKLNSHLNKK